MSTPWMGASSSIVAVEKMKSPIRYREGPLDYEPPVFCKCGAKAARWISWSDDHPGMRYLTCYRAREDDGCDFYVFVDEKPSEFICQALRDFRDTVYEFRRETKALRQQLSEAHQTIEGLQQELEARIREVHVVNDQLTDAVMLVYCHQENETESLKEIEKLTKKLTLAERKSSVFRFGVGVIVGIVIRSLIRRK